MNVSSMVPADPGSPGLRAIKRLYVCVCIRLPVCRSVRYCINILWLHVMFQEQFSCLCVCLSVWWMLEIMADWIWMPFGVEGWVGPRMCSPDGNLDRHNQRGSFGGGYGMAHCNKWGICGVAV